jgi:hypothetical protein
MVEKQMPLRICKTTAEHLAKYADESLHFKGKYYSQTDIKSVKIDPLRSGEI